jgi:hypothetical protein
MRATGAPSREAELWTGPRSCCKTMVATDPDGNISEVPVFEEGDRVFGVVEKD